MARRFSERLSALSRRVVADPPWPYATYSAKGKGRSAGAWYNTMSIGEIAALPVASLAAPNAVLFLWVTKPILPRAFAVIEVWGFRYKTNGFVWVKTYPDPGERAPRFFFGLGHWTRSNPGQCLLATCGRLQRRDKDVAELIVAPVREHSRKPDAIYERVGHLVAGPYLELFARAGVAARPGWTKWVGNAAAVERRWKSDSYPGPASA
jgi:N6-adenosine-specific RNA methylase IME4